MKIDNIELITLGYRYDKGERWSWSGGTTTGVSCSLVQIQTDKGLTGLGEVGRLCRNRNLIKSIVDFFRKLLLKEDPCNIVQVREKMYRATGMIGKNALVISVLGAIEGALWDIFGKSVDLPVYKLFGGSNEFEIPIYASGGVSQTLDELEEEVKEYKEQNYNAVKIRIGSPKIKNNVDRVKAARKVLGEDIKLMADAGQNYVKNPWDVNKAIQITKALKEFNLYWLEEPYIDRDLAGYKKIQNNSPTPLSAGENAINQADVHSLVVEGIVNIFQPDVMWFGGFLSTKKAANIAQQFGIPVVPHCWGSSVSLSATLHFIASTSNCKMAEYQLIPNKFRDILFKTPPTIKESKIKLSQEPGLGVELRKDVLDKYEIDSSEMPGQILNAEKDN